MRDYVPLHHLELMDDVDYQRESSWMQALSWYPMHRLQHVAASAHFNVGFVLESIVPSSTLPWVSLLPLLEYVCA